MVPRIFLSLILTAPVAAMAQYMTTGPNGQLVPAGSTVVVVGNGGGPLLSTPSATFATPQATTGISLSDRAGISNVTPTMQTTPASSESVPVYSNPNQAATNVLPATGESTAVAAATASSGRLINDLGPSYFSGTGPLVGGSGPSGTSVAVHALSAASLGEIAAKYKSERPHNIRTYTNADAQRLSDSMKMGGASITPVNAQNTAPAPAQTQSQVATTQPSAPGTSAAAQPQLTASGRPSPSIRGEMAQSNAGAQQSSSASQTTSSSTQNSSAQVGQSGATTPQVAQPGNRAQDNDQGTRLPASSTLLPLFGLMGLISGGIGIWLRKLRR
jgi:hypothetical protein